MFIHVVMAKEFEGNYSFKDMCWVGLSAVYHCIVAFPVYTHLLFKKEPVHENSQFGKSSTIRELNQA